MIKKNHCIRFFYYVYNLFSTMIYLLFQVLDIINLPWPTPSLPQPFTRRLPIGITRRIKIKFKLVYDSGSLLQCPEDVSGKGWNWPLARGGQRVDKSWPLYNTQWWTMPINTSFDPCRVHWIGALCTAR